MSNFKKAIGEFIDNALLEDVGEGDFTSLACVPKSEKSAAYLLVKEQGTLAGVELALEIFKTVDPGLKIEVLKKRWRKH